ncbi:MAG: hypothetical protein AB2556_00030 [Candidatus Thiodiazotropha sp.]
MLERFYVSLGMEDTFVLRDPEKVSPVAELDRGPEAHPKTVMFDDIRLTPRQLEPIKEYFSAGCHRKVNAIFLAQSYIDVPKFIRGNSGGLVFMPGLDNRDFREIAADHTRSISSEQFEAACREVFAEPFFYFNIVTQAPLYALFSEMV